MQVLNLFSKTKYLRIDKLIPPNNKKRQESFNISQHQTSKTMVLQNTTRGVGSSQKNSKWHNIGKNLKNQFDDKTSINIKNRTNFPRVITQPCRIVKIYAEWDSFLSPIFKIDVCRGGLVQLVYLSRIFDKQLPIG